MHRVFNCGIGLVLVVAAGDGPATIAWLEAQGETAYAIGRVEHGRPGAAESVVA
jgi:phosphoribosylformylglycinamidine cyclo-ligase